MSNKKATKRALLTSILAICLCLVMLIGSTFAWFTDTASTSVNQIQSGTLDVGLQMKDDKDQWVDAEGETLQFKVNGAIPAEGAKILWEPGCTYELPALRVVNKGNLALKYKIQITGIQGNAELNKVITWTINDADISLTEQHLEAKAEGDAFIIKGHMQESAGNDYQDKSIDGISITVLATQDTVEFDSISDQYDKDATFPWRADATVEQETETVVKDKEVDHNVKLTAPAGSLNTSVSKVNLVVVEAQTPGTISVGSTQGSMSYEVTLKDQSGNTVAATGETLFEVEMQIGKNRDSVKMYHDGVLMTDDGANLTNVAEHYVYDKATGYVTMKVSHFSPFTAVYNLGNWTDSVSDSYTTPVDETNKVVTIANAEELALFAKEVNGGKSYAGYTVKLVNDINLSANLWTPINEWTGTFDGNNHIINNLTIISYAGGYGSGFFGTFGKNGTAIMKDVVFDSASIQCMGKNGCAVIAGYAGYYGSAEFDNVTVKNSDVNGFGKVAAFAGMVEMQGGHIYFTNCNIEKTTIRAGYNAAGFAGIIHNSVSGAKNTAVFSDCSADITFDCYGLGFATGVSLEGYEGTYCTYGSDYYAESALYFNEYGAPDLPENMDAKIHNTAYNMNEAA